MRIKGTAFIARRKFVVDKFGQQAWDECMAVLAGAPPFDKPILATTPLPIEAYFRLQEEVLARCFNGNPRAYWDMGVASAQWALTEGPYKAFAATRDIPAFVETIPRIWTSYYDAGKLSARLDGKMVVVELTELPAWHISLELIPMGYVQRALELVCQRAVVSRKESGGTGTSPIRYVFYI